jgi:hypothetical protein
MTLLLQVIFAICSRPRTTDPLMHEVRARQFNKKVTMRDNSQLESHLNF